MLQASQRAKLWFEISGFIEEPDTLILVPAVACAPRRFLCHHLVRTHHDLGGEQSQEPQLSQPTVEQASALADRFEPPPCRGVMRVRLPRQGNPDLHVKEKR